MNIFIPTSRIINVYPVPALELVLTLVCCDVALMGQITDLTTVGVCGVVLCTEIIDRSGGVEICAPAHHLASAQANTTTVYSQTARHRQTHPPHGAWSLGALHGHAAPTAPPGSRLRDWRGDWVRSALRGSRDGASAADQRSPCTTPVSLYHPCSELTRALPPLAALASAPREGR